MANGSYKPPKLATKVESMMMLKLSVVVGIVLLPVKTNIFGVTPSDSGVRPAKKRVSERLLT